MPPRRDPDIAFAEEVGRLVYKIDAWLRLVQCERSTLCGPAGITPGMERQVEQLDRIERDLKRARAHLQAAVKRVKTAAMRRQGIPRPSWDRG